MLKKLLSTKALFIVFILALQFGTVSRVFAQGPIVTVAPKNDTICSPYPNSSFLMYITLQDTTGATYQWQTFGGGGWGNVNFGYSGGTTDTLKRTFGFPPNYNGRQYRVIVTKGGVSDTLSAILYLPSLNKVTPGSNTPVTAGTSINLTATPAHATTTGVWAWTGPSSFTSSTQNPSRTCADSFTMSGIYTVTLTDTGCVVADTSTSVTVNGTLSASSYTLDSSSNSTTCAGDGKIYIHVGTPNAVYNVSYTKDGTPIGPLPDTSNSTGELIIKNLAAGTYTTIIVQLSTCGAPDTFAGPVIITAPASGTAPTAGSNSPICAGSTLNLTASTITGATYSWSGPGITGATANLQNPSIAGATIAMAGVYSVTASVGGCTSAPATTIVVINPGPTATITPSPTLAICAGDTAYLGSSTCAGCTYQWAKNGTPTLGATGTVLAVNSLGSYTVTITSSSSCTATSTPTVVTVNAKPTATATAGGPTTFCSPGSVILTANAGAGLTYQWYDSASVSGYVAIVGATGISYTASTTGCYRVVVTNSSSLCFNTSASICVNSTTSVTSTDSIGGNNSVCLGSSTTLTAYTNIVGGNYQWKKNGANVGANSPTYTFTPANGDIITCTITAIGTCYSPNPITSAPDTMSVISTVVVPTLSIAGTNPVCSGSGGTYTATTNVVGGTFQWKVNGVNAGINSATFSYTPANGDQVSCTVTTPAGGCYTLPSVTSNIITIVVNTTPATPTASSNSPICAGSGTNLNLTSSSTTPGVSYHWIGPNSFVSNTQNPTIIAPTAINSGTYSVTATLGSCTSAAATVNVVISNMPNIAGTSFTNPTACGGCNGTITLTGLVAGTTYSVSYSNGASTITSNMTANASGNVVISSLCGGNYSNFSATLNGCTSNIIAGPVSLASSSAPPLPSVTSNSPVCVGGTLNLFASSTVPGAIYSWNGPSSFSSGLQNPSRVNMQLTYAGAYSVTVTDPMSGCISTPVSTTVLVLTAPMTPTLTISGVSSLCAGSSGAATYTAVTNVVNGTYQWHVNGVNVGGNSSSYTYSPVVGDVITCTVTTPAGSCYTAATVNSNTITITLASSIVPVISITGNDTVCTGNAITYTAATNVVGGTYNWHVNGASVGTNSSTYTYNPTNGDVITCTITTASSCYTIPSVTSNAISIFVTSTPIVPTISISGNDTVCMGSQATYYATTNVSGGTFEWIVNGLVVYPSNTYVYSPANGDHIQCIVTTPATGCYTTTTAFSNIITVATVTSITPSIVISGPSLAAIGSNVTVNATVMNAGSSYIITWMNHGVTFNTTTVPTVTYVKTSGLDSITARIISLSPGCYDTTLSNLVQVFTSTGVNNVANSFNMNIYPNPTNNVLHIDNLSTSLHYRLMNIVGSVVVEGALANTNNTISTKEMAAGVYMLEVRNNDGLKNIIRIIKE